MLALLWTAAFFASGIALSIGTEAPPAAVPADAPADQFSAHRAVRHVREIAAKPHPVGSPEAAEVRVSIERTLKQFGLEPGTLTVTFQTPAGERQLVDIIARLKGTGSAGKKAVVLMSHYDSVPNAPGASDDGSGVATLFETLRALRSGPPLRRDVIFLFTDGEEIGLIGSRCILGEHRGGIGPGHPWIDDFGLVLNIEASGNRGPCYMFETGENNGWLMREFARAAPYPIASSLAPVVYGLLPNSTDLTNFIRAGFPGLNFAYIEGKWCYHTPNDNVANLDLRSLQHQGSYALSLSRHFGNLERDDPREADAVYFNPIGYWLVVYPGSWVKPLAVAAALLYIATVCAGFRAGRLSLRGFAGGIIALPAALAAGSGGAWGVLKLLQTARPEVDWEATSGPVALLLLLVALALFLAVYAPLWNRAGTANLDLGALAWWALASVLLAWALPGASYAPLWILLFRLTATLLGWCTDHPALAGALQDAGALAALAIVPAEAFALYTAIRVDVPAILAAAALLLPAAALPQLARLVAPRRQTTSSDGSAQG
jgi:hypothetical protein